ncbi:hypothetical protein GGI21_004137 [Coemansia aciculifera]|nr:hypothetical protein GGI21_004137 [Coemansia aciculifera]
MFTSSAAYIGACIHLQNLKVTPRWEMALRRHSELSDAHAGGGGGPGVASTSLSMAEAREMGILPSSRDIGALPPPPLLLPLPALPCTPDQAREGVKPLVKILEGIEPYWRVGGRVDRIRAMWREIEGSDLLPSAQVRASPSARIPGPPSMPVMGLDAGHHYHYQQQQQQHLPAPQRHHPHQHHHPSSQSPPHPPMHYRQPSLPTMSIEAISNGSQVSAVGPPPLPLLPPPPVPPFSMTMSSRMPPPPRP